MPDKDSLPFFSRERLGPLIHLSNDWISLIGVVIVTTATVFWLFLLPFSLRGEVSHPYIGILVFMALPAIFILGLILIPIGIVHRRRREKTAGTEPSFPSINWQNRDFRRLSISARIFRPLMSRLRFL